MSTLEVYSDYISQFILIHTHWESKSLFKELYIPYYVQKLDEMIALDVLGLKTQFKITNFYGQQILFVQFKGWSRNHRNL